MGHARFSVRINQIKSNQCLLSCILSLEPSSPRSFSLTSIDSASFMKIDEHRSEVWYDSNAVAMTQVMSYSAPTYLLTVSKSSTGVGYSYNFNPCLQEALGAQSHLPTTGR